jgi:hypothetical protein
MQFFHKTKSLCWPKMFEIISSYISYIYIYMFSYMCVCVFCFHADGDDVDLKLQDGIPDFLLRRKFRPAFSRLCYSAVL